jgi:uncharacterized integral membrane protein (TIGR00698 family)
MKQLKIKLPGILLTAIIAFPAWKIGEWFPVVGSPVMGILIGMLLAGWRRPQIFSGGIQFTSKKILQYSIVLLGFGMNLFNVFHVGTQTLMLMVFTLTAALLTAFFAGKLLGLNGNTRTLIGVGSAICGGSAIAAAAPVINADEAEVAHSISTIFLFNVIAAFLFPFLGHVLGMSNQTFGLWAGTAINDTSSVVAAGYSFSDQAGDLAVVVKLTRTLMIIPVTLVLALYSSKKSKSGNYQFSKIFPWFVLFFILASVLRTFLPLPENYVQVATLLGRYMIVMAMAAIGLNTNLLKLIKNGVKPILLGFICWVVLALTSLGAQYILF